MCSQDTAYSISKLFFLFPSYRRNQNKFNFEHSLENILIPWNSIFCVDYLEFNLIPDLNGLLFFWFLRYYINKRNILNMLFAVAWLQPPKNNLTLYRIFFRKNKHFNSKMKLVKFNVKFVRKNEL